MKRSLFFLASLSHKRNLILLTKRGDKMDDKILINQKTGQEYTDVPATVAAKYLGVALNFVYEGLKKQKLPIGSAA